MIPDVVFIITYINYLKMKMKILVVFSTENIEFEQKILECALSVTVEKVSFIYVLKTFSILIKNLGFLS